MNFQADGETQVLVKMLNLRQKSWLVVTESFKNQVTRMSMENSKETKTNEPLAILKFFFNCCFYTFFVPFRATWDINLGRYILVHNKFQTVSNFTPSMKSFMKSVRSTIQLVISCISGNMWLISRFLLILHPTLFLLPI